MLSNFASFRSGIVWSRGRLQLSSSQKALGVSLGKGTYPPALDLPVRSQAELREFLQGPSPRCLWVRLAGLSLRPPQAGPRATSARPSASPTTSVALSSSLCCSRVAHSRPP